MQHYLRLHMQKKNDAIKFLLNPTSLMGLDYFGLGHNNPHEFGKFGATASSGAKSHFVLRLFHVMRIVDFSN